MSRRFRVRAAILVGALVAAALPPVAAPAQSTSEVVRLIRGTSPASALIGPTAKLPDRATERYAVVIGNGAYEHVNKLWNAASDARAMAAFLKAHGFEVIARYDLDKRGFEDLLRQVLIQVSPDSEILFYYAGHGIQIGRRNYLIPVDADLKTAYDTPFETVTLDSVVAILGARSRMQLVFLDSCRNNPFADIKVMTEVNSTLFETREGFNPMAAPVNTLLAYSTSPGHVALDGEGGNSPFTTALLKIASAEPKESIGHILESVRREVFTETGGEQVPWESSTLVEPFLFSGGETRIAMAGSSDAAPAGSKPAGSKPAESRGVELPPAPVAPEGGGTALQGPLERHLALGAGLAQMLKLDPGAQISVKVETPDGRLLLDDGAMTEYQGGPLSADDLGKLIYEYTPVQSHIDGDISAYARHERLALSVSAGGATRAVETAVSLDLTPDPCDYQAGDWLDPDGIGLARYPNEIDPEKALAACKAAVAQAPQNGRFHYQLGRALQAERRYDEAKAEFEKARDLGHTRAWHALGDLAADAESIAGGRADKQAPMAALELYSEGVRRGDPYAYHALGKQLLRYGDTETARRYGFELLSRALELGHTFSMNELGYYFMKEGSPDFEPQRGLRYLEESAARNDIYGFHNLGLVYDAGLGGIKPDAQLALSWYEKAAAGGHPDSPVNIGRMYFQGRLGNGPDFAKAIEWYDKGLARGGAWGGANAAWIIASKHPAGYSMADAAVRAAKTMALRNAGASEAAGKVLAALDVRDINRGAQTFLSDLGTPVTVDGVIGPQTEAAIAKALQDNGIDAATDAPQARLVALARAYWTQHSFRIDLY